MSITTSSALVLLLGGILFGREAAAQRLTPDYVNSPTALSLNHRVAPPLVVSTARDHRWEGLIIGALVGGAVVGAFRYGFCSDSGNGSCAGPVIVWTLGGMTIGAVTGGLIGSEIPKASPNTASY